MARQIDGVATRQHISIVSSQLIPASAIKRALTFFGKSIGAKLISATETGEIGEIGEIGRDSLASVDDQVSV